MTTTAKTWFYSAPEKNAYAIGERVRTNFWDARFGGIWLETVRVEPPILMTGQYQGSKIELEWEPGKWCRLRTHPESSPLATGVANILGFKPAFKYEDAKGNAVWEWRVSDAEARWQAVQGKPEFGKLEKLK